MNSYDLLIFRVMAWWHPPASNRCPPRFSPTVTVLLGLEEAAVGLSLRLFRQVQLGARLVQLLLGKNGPAVALDLKMRNKSHDGHDGHVTRMMINSGFWDRRSLIPRSRPITYPLSGSKLCLEQGIKHLTKDEQKMGVAKTNSRCLVGLLAFKSSCTEQYNHKCA